MKNLLKVGIVAFAFSIMFIGADSVNAQNRQKTREARREYRGDIRDARQDYRKDIRSGKSRREALRDLGEERRSARRDYRSETGKRINRRILNRGILNRSRVNQPRYRVYYRNGRRYVVRY